MRVIEPSVELMTPFDGNEVLKFIEICGRVCYRSEKKITEDSAVLLMKNLIKRGHESVLEHFHCTFKIICDRGIMAELTRHRLANFSVESTRYCDYKDGLTFIKPLDFAGKNLDIWQNRMALSEHGYKALREAGAKPEQARAILPTSLATKIIMTANLREWRHILKLRTAKDAHPQMRQIANMILKILKEKLPVIFEDLGETK